MVLVIVSAVFSFTCSVLVYVAMISEDYPAAAAIAVLGICLTNTVTRARYSWHPEPQPETPPAE